MNRRTLSIFPLVSVLALALVAGSAVGAPKAKVGKRQLVGSWTLVSITPSSPTAQVYGPNDGVVTFEADGRFVQALATADLPKYASNNRDSGTPEENKAIIHGSLSFFGTYSLDEADGTLTLHVERGSFPNWNGTDQKRMITSLTANELKWHNPGASAGGTTETVWKRGK